jgi:hypothetical protein
MGNTFTNSYAVINVTTVAGHESLHTDALARMVV